MPGTSAGGRKLRWGARALLAVAAFAAPASAAAASLDLRPLRVISPKTDRLVRGGSVRVEVRAARDARELRAKLNGRKVHGLFGRDGATWTATLPAALLRPGPNRLELRTANARGRRGFQTARFIAGRARPGLLSVAAPGAAASSVAVSARTGKSPDLLFKAWLNDEPVANAFELRGRHGRRARLGADDGLRFGPNELRVLAARRNGTYDEEVRTILVRRDAPLVGAGGPVRTAGGHRVKLRSRSSKRSVPGSRLAYSWKVISAPKGSKATARRQRGSRAVFEPDALGTYRLELTVSEGSRTGSDAVTIINAPSVPPIGMPINTMVFNGVDEIPGADTGIQVGSQVYWLGNAENPQTDPTVQVLVLDRATLAFKWASSYVGTAADAQSILGKIKKMGSDRLVVVSNPPLFSDAVNPGFAAVVKALGADPIAKLVNGDSGFTVVGVPGSKQGGFAGAGTNPGLGVGLQGQLSGYLQDDAELNFNFVPGERPLFDTAAPGGPALQNTIAVGSQQIGSGALSGCGTGGFQVAVLYAETLQQVDNRAFTTNGCGAGPDQSAQAAMAGYLKSVPGQGNRLVAVQSIGNARGADDDGWTSIAGALPAVGGTPAAFASATGAYALVGSVGIDAFPLTEQSASLTGAPGRISGVLVQDRSGSFRPQTSVPGPISTSALAGIAYQPAQPWPYSQSQAHKDALTYIARNLTDYPAPTPDNSCYVPPQPDVRSEYCNTALFDDFATYSGEVTKVPFEKGHGFDRTQLNDVATKLSSELLLVSQVWPTVQALQKAYGTARKAAKVDLNGLASAIKSDLKAPNGGETAGSWLDYIAAVANLASYFAEDVATPVGVLSGGLYVAADVVTRGGGDPVLAGFDLEAKDFAVELASTYQTASSQLFQLGNLLVTDHGKLTAFGANPNFEVSASTIGTIANGIERMSRGWGYEVLTPAAYEAFSLIPTVSLNDPLPTNANAYRCDLPLSEGGSPYRPFNAAPGAQYYLTDLGAPILLVMVENGSDPPDITPSSSGDALNSPPAAVINQVFQQPGQSSGAGEFRPWFWRETMGFGAPGPGPTTVTCRDE